MALRPYDRVWCWVVSGLGVSCGVPELAYPWLISVTEDFLLRGPHIIGVRAR
jgi:hypothetical protein